MIHQPLPERLVKTGITEKEWNVTLSLFGAAYLLATIADRFMQNAVDTLDKHRMNVFRLKKCWGDYTRAFDRYNTEIHTSLIKEQQANFVEDEEGLSRMVCDFIFKEEENWNWEQRYLFEKAKHQATIKEFNAYKLLHPEEAA